VNNKSEEIKIKKEENVVTVSAKITKSFYQLILKYLKKDAHLTMSDFIRDSMREKIQHEAPELYKTLFEECEEREDAS